MKYTSGLVVSGLPPKEYWIDSPIGQTFLCSLILLNVGVGSNQTTVIESFYPSKFALNDM